MNGSVLLKRIFDTEATIFNVVDSGIVEVLPLFTEEFVKMKADY